MKSGESLGPTTIDIKANEKRPLNRMALNKMYLARDVEGLGKILTGESPAQLWFRHRAAISLGQIDSKESIPFLVRGLKDKKPSIRLACLNVLQSLRRLTHFDLDKEAEDRIRKLSDKALAKLDDPNCSDKDFNLAIEIALGSLDFLEKESESDNPIKNRAQEEERRSVKGYVDQMMMVADLIMETRDLIMNQQDLPYEEILRNSLERYREKLNKTQRIEYKGKILRYIENHHFYARLKKNTQEGGVFEGKEYLRDDSQGENREQVEDFFKKSLGFMPYSVSVTFLPDVIGFSMDSTSFDYFEYLNNRSQATPRKTLEEYTKEGRHNNPFVGVCTSGTAGGLMANYTKIAEVKNSESLKHEWQHHFLEQYGSFGNGYKTTNLVISAVPEHIRMLNSSDTDKDNARKTLYQDLTDFLLSRYQTEAIPKIFDAKWHYPYELSYEEENMQNWIDSYKETYVAELEEGVFGKIEDKKIAQEIGDEVWKSTEASLWSAKSIIDGLIDFKAKEYEGLHPKVDPNELGQMKYKAYQRANEWTAFLLELISLKKIYRLKDFAFFAKEKKYEVFKEWQSDGPKNVQNMRRSAREFMRNLDKREDLDLQFSDALSVLVILSILGKDVPKNAYSSEQRKDYRFIVDTLGTLLSHKNIAEDMKKDMLRIIERSEPEGGSVKLALSEALNKIKGEKDKND